jgi:hypothetical protein
MLKSLVAVSLTLAAIAPVWSASAKAPPFRDGDKLIAIPSYAILKQEAYHEQISNP